MLNYLKQNIKAFTSSFRKSLIFSILADLVYYIILVLSFMFYSAHVFPLIYKLKDAVLNSQKLIYGNELSYDYVLSLSAAKHNIIVYTIFFLGFVVLLYSVFKLLFWFIYNDNKIPKKKDFFAKLWPFAVLNTMLMLLFFFLAYVSSKIIVPTASLFVLILIIIFHIYLVNILHPLFFLSKSTKAFFNKLSFVFYFYLFILPYTVIFLVLFVLVNFIVMFKFLPDTVYYSLLIALVVSFLSWAKAYLFNIAKLRLKL